VKPQGFIQVHCAQKAGERQVIYNSIDGCICSSTNALPLGLEGGKVTTDSSHTQLHQIGELRPRQIPYGVVEDADGVQCRPASNEELIHFVVEESAQEKLHQRTGQCRQPAVLHIPRKVLVEITELVVDL